MVHNKHLTITTLINIQSMLMKMPMNLNKKIPMMKNKIAIKTIKKTINNIK
jgi:hypothetical protein